MKQYKWLLLDLDNTIFDFDAGKTVALKQLLIELFGEVKQTALDTYRIENKKCWQMVEAGTLDVDQVNIRRIAKTLEVLNYQGDYQAVADRYVALLADNPILFEGAYQTLAKLRQNYKLAAITNGFANVKRPHLAKTDTHQFFEDVFISAELGISKPQTLFFDKVLAAISAERQDCLVIGDSLSSDILGGINSGIDTCWYNRHAAKSDAIRPTYIVENYTELLKLL